ncbi:MAG: RNA-guided endonuclease InsQ/TnpB family protein [Candidatus Bipolaricaulia bacterium]
MKRAYQYRLYPTKKQAQALEQLLVAGQRLYNASLEHRLLCWRWYRKPVWYLDQASDLKAIRNEHPDIGVLNFSACQQVLRRLDKVYREFVNGKRGRPRFKPLARFRSLEFRFGDGTSLTKNHRLRIQNAGEIKVRWHRGLPDGAKIKDLVLTRHADGKWFVTFRFEFPNPTPPAHTGPAVGIDVGLESFATLSTGEKIVNPRWYRQSEERLKAVQQRYSKCKSRRQRNRLSQLHAKVQRQRKDFLHKLSHRLTQEFSRIAVEKLNIKNMTANGHNGLNKSIYDAGWGTFVPMLGYKVERTGSKLVKVNPAYTSQQCASCGQLVPKMLSLRVHDCPHCDFRCDRDLNAALVILSKATGWEPAHGLAPLKPAPL